MTNNQTLALAVGAIGLYLLSKKTAAAAVSTPVVSPAGGVIAYPGYSPTSYLSGSGGVMNPSPPSPVAVDPVTGGGGMYEIYGTGMTASELKALGYTDSQISAMGMSGDPAISSILNLTPQTDSYPVLSSDSYIYDYLNALPTA